MAAYLNNLEVAKEVLNTFASPDATERLTQIYSMIPGPTQVKLNGIILGEAYRSYKNNAALEDAAKDAIGRIQTAGANRGQEIKRMELHDYGLLVSKVTDDIKRYWAMIELAERDLERLETRLQEQETQLNVQ